MRKKRAVNKFKSKTKSLWVNVPNDRDEYVGMVYEIKELDTGMKYIGIRRFWANPKVSHTKKPNKSEQVILDKYKDVDKKKYTAYKKKMTAKYKGKKVTTRVRKESDWRTYKTSSDIMQQKLEKKQLNYVMICVRPCKTVTELKAHEAYMQLDYYIKGNWDKLYNGYIGIKMRIR